MEALRLEEHGFYQELKGRSGQMCHPREKAGEEENVGSLTASPEPGSLWLDS